jgi:ferredoxin-type protein NapG
MSATRREFLKNAIATGATAITCGGVAGLCVDDGSASAAPLRPPGAMPEAEFLARCIRCLRCVEACPNNAIISLDDSLGRRRRNTPAIKARRQACMLCNKIEGEYLKCTQACPSGALRPVRRDSRSIRSNVKMGVAEIDLALCYSYNNWSCGACYRACPFPGQAMSIGMWERPEVNAEVCVGCGSCERACIRYPQAIRVRPSGHVKADEAVLPQKLQRETNESPFSQPAPTLEDL